MGACVSAQRGACTECTFSAQPGRKGLLTRAPSTLPQDQGPGRPAAAVTSTPTSTADKRLYDSASSTPRPSRDHTSSTCAAAADITATASPVDTHLAPTATAAITLTPAHKTKGVKPLKAADWGIRLREERAAKITAERGLAVFAMMTAHLERQLRGEQDGCGAAEDALRDKSAALAAAEQLAADLGRQLTIEQHEHAAEKGTLRAKLAVAEQQEGQLKATQVQLAEQACQLSIAEAQLAEHGRQLSAAQAQLAQQEARLSLLPKIMARAAELARQLAAAETTAADAKAKLKTVRRKDVCLAWMHRKTEYFAQALEALHDTLPHLSEDDLTTVGVLGQGGFARVDHKTVTLADGSTAEVAVKVVLPPEQPAAAAEASSAAADASSHDSPALSSAASSEADSAASSTGDPAPAAACSVAPATCDSEKDKEDGSDRDEDEDQDSDIGDDEEDGSESSEDEEEGSETDEDEEEDAEEVDMSDEALQASLKLRALRLEGAVLNKLRGQPCILGAQAWQGEGRTGLVLPLAMGGSLKELLWPVPGDRSAFVPQDRDQVLRIAGGLCTALLAAHAQGVAHLDVKADNVLLDSDFNVQLADWGTAAPLSFTAAQWRARGIMGSAGLIFPGVLYNPESGGVRHDVYAAGALCYGVLTGRDYPHECWEQYRALPKATRMAICEEAGERCEKLGYSGVDPTSMEILMVAQLRGYVGAVQVEQHLRLLGGARMPEPLAPLACWTQQALCMVTWRRRKVTLQDMQSAIAESWQRLHLLA
ncbi:g2833 [Coccomyxa elongata]